MPAKPKPRGSILVRVEQATLDRLDAVRARVDGHPSQPEMIRRLLVSYLDQVEAKTRARPASQ